MKFRYDGGMRDFVRHVNSSKEALFSDVAGRVIRRLRTAACKEPAIDTNA